MAAELVTDFQSALEIDLRPVPPAPRCRQPQRLGTYIDGKPGAAALLAGTDHREARTRAGNRQTVGDGRPRIATGNFQAMQSLPAPVYGDYLADVGYDAGEHENGCWLVVRCKADHFPLFG